MQELAQLGIPLPKDLSPLQRARLKIVWHLLIMAVINGILALVVLIDQNNVVTWQTVLTVAGGQAALALADGAKKYANASGDISISTIVNLVASQIANRVQPLPNNPYQGIQQSIDNALQPTPDVTATQSFNTAPPTQTSTIRYTANAQLASQPVQSLPPVQPAVDPNYHPAISASDMLNTFPGIPAIGKPQ